MGDTVGKVFKLATFGGTAEDVKDVYGLKKPKIKGSKAEESSDVRGAEASERERLRLRRQRGRAATILTSALGDTSTPSLGRKMLLGE